MPGRRLDNWSVTRLVTRERHEDFRARGCIIGFFGGEFLELRVRKQHDIDGRADNHASGGFVSELRLKAKPSLLKNPWICRGS